MSISYFDFFSFSSFHSNEFCEKKDRFSWKKETGISGSKRRYRADLTLESLSVVMPRETLDWINLYRIKLRSTSFLSSTRPMSTMSGLNSKKNYSSKFISRDQQHFFPSSYFVLIYNIQIALFISISHQSSFSLRLILYRMLSLAQSKKMFSLMIWKRLEIRKRFVPFRDPQSAGKYRVASFFISLFRLKQQQPRQQQQQ